MNQVRQANNAEVQIKEENKSLIQDTKTKNSDRETKKKKIRERTMKLIKEGETEEGKKITLEIIQSEEEGVWSEEPKKQETNKKNNEKNIKEEHEEKKRDSSSKNKKTE